MRRHSFVVTVATGALLLGACKGNGGVIRNPPAPEPVPMPDSSLPTWDQVASGHPPGATNPPIPHLVVKPDGTCYKLWVSPMMRPEPGKTGDYVDPTCVGEDCGTPIQCPERAAEVLAAWKAGEAPPEGK